MDICDYIAYGCAYFLLGMGALCMILYRDEIFDWCMDKGEKVYQRYRFARHVVYAIKKAIRDECAEQKEKRRNIKIMKLQRRQILNTARLKELKNTKTDGK